MQATVTQALLQDRRIKLTYRPRDAQEDRHYETNLLGLVVRDPMIYLVCNPTSWQGHTVRSSLNFYKLAGHRRAH